MKPGGIKHEAIVSQGEPAPVTNAALADDADDVTRAERVDHHCPLFERSPLSRHGLSGNGNAVTAAASSRSARAVTKLPSATSRRTMASAMIPSRGETT